MTDPDAVQRLRSARGHLDAVIRMIEGYADGRVEEIADELIGAFFGGRVSGTRHCHHTGHGASRSCVPSRT